MANEQADVPNQQPQAPEAGVTQAVEEELAPVGFWVRAGAYVIDLLLLVVVNLVFEIPLYLAGQTGGVFHQLIKVVVWVLYFTWLTGMSGQTVGKMAAGIKVAAMHPRVLNPLPEERLKEFVGSVKHVLVPEVNYQGQFAHYLGANLGMRPIRLNKIGGLPFTPGEIYNKIQEVLVHA